MKNTRRLYLRRILAAALTLLAAACVAAVSAAATSGEDTTPEVPIVSAVITGVRIGKAPDKTEYYVGEDLSVAGAELLIEYSDGRVESAAVREDWCSGFDAYTAGSCEVTVTYPEGGSPVKFTVSIVRPSVSFITVKKLPDRTSYYTGQTFSSDGISVMATYNNGYTEDVTPDVTFSGTDLSEASNSHRITVVLRSDGKQFTASFNVKVIARSPASLKIVKAPAKTEYGDGDPFDPSGIELSVVYNDGSAETPAADEVKYTGFDSSKLGAGTVTATARGVSAGLGINIVLSASHVHTASAPETVTPATCTASGSTRVLCSVCGQIVSTGIIPATGHRFGEWVTDVPATPGAAGKKSRTCTVCGFAESEDIPPLSARAVSADGRFSVTLKDGGMTEDSCFPAGTELAFADILPVLTNAERDRYAAAAGERDGTVISVFSAEFKLPGGTKLPSGDAKAVLGFDAAAHPEYVKYLLFTADGVLFAVPQDGRFEFDTVLPGGFPGGMATFVLAGVKAPVTQPPETSEPPAPNTVPATEAEETDLTEPGTGTQSSDATSHEPPDRSHDPEETTDGEETDMAVDTEKLGKIFGGAGLLTAGLFVTALAVAFVYKRFLYRR